MILALLFPIGYQEIHNVQFSFSNLSFSTFFVLFQINNFDFKAVISDVDFESLFWK